MFAITRHCGFHMTFENGVTLSVQFGPGNYCERRYPHDHDAPQKETAGWESKDAEIAILMPDGVEPRFYPLPHGENVMGWQSVEDVCKWIEFARNIKTEVTT